MSKVVTIGNIKGGSGKSTLSGNLAVMSARAGLKTLLVDADPDQGSSTAFRVSREAEDIQGIAMSHDRIHREIREFDNFDFIIIDAGGKDTATFRSAVAAADVCLIPILPSIYDIWAANETLDVVRDVFVAKDSVDIPFKAYILMNIVIPNSVLGREVAAALEAYKEFSPVMKNKVHHREDYKKAPSQGLGVVEFAPRSKAAAEMIDLWNEVKKLTGI